MPGDNSKSKGRSSTQIVAELTVQLFELQRSDDFEVLGIDRTADDEALRLAYLELSKRYHPHRFAKHRSAEVSRLANEIYVCVQAAYGRLSGSHRVPGASEKAKPRTVRTHDDLAVSRAVELIDFHQYDAAAVLLAPIVKANPDHEDAQMWLHLARARRHKLTGDNAAAAASYRALLEIKPQHPEALVEADRLGAQGKKSMWTRLLKLGG